MRKAKKVKVDFDDLKGEGWVPCGWDDAIICPGALGGMWGNERWGSVNWSSNGHDTADGHFVMHGGRWEDWVEEGKPVGEAFWDGDVEAFGLNRDRFKDMSFMTMAGGGRHVVKCACGEVLDIDNPEGEW